MNTLVNLVNSLNNSLYTKPLSISRQIDLSSNNISSLGDNASSLKDDKNFLDNRL